VIFLLEQHVLCARFYSKKIYVLKGDVNMRFRGLKQIGYVIVLLMVLTFSVNVADAAEPAPLKIGFVGSMTGVASPWAVPGRIMYQWVVDQVNKEGGIKSMGGAKVQLFVSDCESDAKKAATEVEKMLTLRKPQAMLSVISSPMTKVAMPICQRHKVPMVGVEQSDELYTMNNPFWFGITPKISRIAIELADLFMKNGKETGHQMKRAAVLCQDGTFGETASDTWGKYLPTKGVQVVANEIYPTGKVSDFSDTIAKFKALNADALFCTVTPPESALIVRAMKATDFNPLGYALGCTCLDTPDFLNLSKDRDFAFGGPLFSAQEIGQKIQGAAAIIKKFYSDPEVSEKDKKLCSEKDVLERMLAIGVVIHAFERAKSYDPVVIRDAIAQLDLKIGDRFVYWPDRIKFDKTGYNSPVRIIGGQYQNMELKILFPESMVTAGTKPVWPMPKWRER
jgi:branched-chain amino acid transport system substrate-binding protein